MDCDLWCSAAGDYPTLDPHFQYPFAAAAREVLEILASSRLCGSADDFCPDRTRTGLCVD